MARVARALLFLAIAAVPALAANYDITWSSGVDYTGWASDKNIQPGDTVTFQYGGLHNVEEVSKTDYGACASSNTLSTASDGNTVITLDKPGTRYFICGTTGHCDQGMKVAIPVSAATSTTPSTPSTETGTAPATPASTPGTTTTTTTTPSSPSKQSSNTSAAAVFHPAKGFLAGMVLVGLAALLG